MRTSPVRYRFYMMPVMMIITTDAHSFPSAARKFECGAPYTCLPRCCWILQRVLTSHVKYVFNQIDDVVMGKSKGCVLLPSRVFNVFRFWTFHLTFASTGFLSRLCCRHVSSNFQCWQTELLLFELCRRLGVCCGHAGGGCFEVIFGSSLFECECVWFVLQQVSLCCL